MEPQNRSPVPPSASERLKSLETRLTRSAAAALERRLDGVDRVSCLRKCELPACRDSTGEAQHCDKSKVALRPSQELIITQDKKDAFLIDD